ncbi:hypothetical protein HYW21_09250 [Candidatus Woesearchaeota archaeon]|nr:hypothetical protein [Candidatus Woesearchaeota archaeon]
MQLTDQLTNKTFLAKGKRGVVYTAELEDRKVCIKQKNPHSHAYFRIEYEGKMLQKVNQYGIGPRLIASSEHELIYEFVDGVAILDFIASATKAQIGNVLKDIFDQCYLLDQHGLTKEEMHHPVKHILVTHEGKPIMIDFERCRYTEKPQNVTQFCQFLLGKKLRKMLSQKGFQINDERVLKLTKNYKSERNKEIFVEITKEFIT